MFASVIGMAMFTMFFAGHKKEYFYNWDRPGDGHPSEKLIEAVFHPDEFTTIRENLIPVIKRHVKDCPTCLNIINGAPEAA